MCRVVMLDPAVVPPAPARPRPWSGNQAALLYFAVFPAFALALLAYLSAPLIPSIAVAAVATPNGTVSLGVWGWCADLRDAGGNYNGTRCSAHRAFGGSMAGSLDALPEAVRGVADVSAALNDPYVVANTVMHLFGCIALWLTVVWTLTAAGAWNAQRADTALKWTRWSFAGAFWSAVFVLIAWALDLGYFTRVQSAAVNADGSQPSVSAGAAIWMNLCAWLLVAGAFAVRVAWSKWLPQPSWARDPADFLPGGQAPVLASDEQPPTWESLNLSPAPVDEKPPVDDSGMAV
ncbi:hypothetical protein Q5752_006968 [Cryptotrichosporon argae]